MAEVFHIQVNGDNITLLIETGFVPGIVFCIIQSNCHTNTQLKLLSFKWRIQHPKKVIFTVTSLSVTNHLGNPLALERWPVISKLALLAKGGISVDTLREALRKMKFPLEPVYGENIENGTAHSERDHRMRNEQLKKTWLNKCQKITAAVSLHRDRLWKIYDSSAVSWSYLSLDAEVQLIFGSNDSNYEIKNMRTREMCALLDYIFTPQRVITFDRYTFLTVKQLKAEPILKFLACLRNYQSTAVADSRIVYHP